VRRRWQKRARPRSPSLGGWYEACHLNLPRAFRIGIDTGGTFTDIVSVDMLSGKDARDQRLRATPANPAIGLVRGVNEILTACRRHRR